MALRIGGLRFGGRSLLPLQPQVTRFTRGFQNGPSLPKVECYLSTVDDPWINLAFEDWLFKKKTTAKYILYLWRNRQCVVIGRNQNPWRECNLALMADDQVPLVRRRSGGGAVYHDLGNSNYTVVMPREEFERKTSAQLVCRALHQLDIPASVNERYDLVIADRKISGSAYKLVNNRAYHHGTMLIDSDLAALGRYLKPLPKNIVGGGVASVRSKVTRLREHSFTVDHTSVCEAIAAEFYRKHGVPWTDPIELAEKDLDRDPYISASYEELKTWDWTYAQTPEFAHRLEKTFSWGSLDVLFKIHRGKIIHSNFEVTSERHTAVASRISEALIGKEYSSKGLDEAFEKVVHDLNLYDWPDIAELQNWLRTSL